MKNPAFSFFLVLSSLFLLPLDSFAVATKTVRGTIFRDPNGNNRLDAHERGGVAATLWLYRVLADGSTRRIRQVRTDQVGNYAIPNVAYGRYFLSVRYSTGLSVRTGVFRVGSGGVGSNRSLAFVTQAMINSNPAYQSYAVTTSPANLNQGPTTPVSPSSP